MSNNGTQTTALTTTQNTAISTAAYAPPQKPGRLDRFAFEPQDITQLHGFSEMVIRSGLAPRSLKTPQAVALACIQGRELGLSSCAALQGLTVINGVIGFRARLVSNLVKSSSVCRLWRVIETDEMIGLVEVQHVTWSESQIVRYTIEDAKNAGLWGSTDPWRKHPRDMLIARAITRAVDRHFSEVLAGVPMDAALEDTTAQAVTVAAVEPQNTKTKAPPTKGMAGLKAALAEPEAVEPEAVEVEPEAVEVIEAEEHPTREAAAEQWRTLRDRLVELIGEEKTGAACASIKLENKRSAKGRQKALDSLSEILANEEAGGF